MLQNAKKNLNKWFFVEVCHFLCPSALFSSQLRRVLSNNDKLW